MIKPDAVKAGAAEAIIKEVEAAGFTVLGQVEKTLTEVSDGVRGDIRAVGSG